MTVQLAAIPSLVAHVRALAGSFYLRREVSNALGVSPAPLIRMAELAPDLLGPTHETHYGRVRVLLYDHDAVEQLHAHVAAHCSIRGRPRLWTDEERRSRRAAHSAAGYRRRRAADLGARGNYSCAPRPDSSGSRVTTR